jgi:membrane protease YdiL (CAAX protease family)
MKQLSIAAMLILWAAVSTSAILFAVFQGYGGHAFLVTAATFATLFLIVLLFAARGVADRLAKQFGPTGGFLLAALLFIVYMFYLVGTGSFTAMRGAEMAAFIFIPVGIAVASGTSAPGSWGDYFTLAGMWVFIKFGPSHFLWPYPDARLSYVLTILVAIGTGLAAFVLVRRFNGVGYSIGWGKRWTFYILAAFAIFACVAIPAAIAMHFVAFDPRWHAWPSFVPLAIAILFFTAWPEEFLFRGLLQTMLTRSTKNDLAAWWTASMLFGFSHITNMHFPNWRYVTLAAVAGLFYGWTWRRCGSMFASAIVHAAVDIIWHFFFRTL